MIIVESETDNRVPIRSDDFLKLETIKMVFQRACAFVTYTTREGAEKAAEELSNKLVIKGLRLKLMWGRHQTAKPDSESSDQARSYYPSMDPQRMGAVIPSQDGGPSGATGTRENNKPNLEIMRRERRGIIKVWR
ncbi:hypothetical protein K1719_014653 [Acacia pycnantha]|nr:hypothetical protein K1719_014653 [Acacia pycnantha]